MSSAQIVSATAMQNKMAATAVAHAAAAAASATHTPANVTHEHTVIKQQPPSPSASPAAVSAPSHRECIPHLRPRACVVLFSFRSSALSRNRFQNKNKAAVGPACVLARARFSLISLASRKQVAQ